MDNTMKLLSVKRMLKTVLFLVFAFVLLAVLLSGGSPAIAGSGDPSRGAAAVLLWNEIAMNVSFPVSNQSPPQSTVYISYVQAAVYDAVSNIQGEYEPYHLKLDHVRNASVDAAVGTAAYEMLVYLFPTQQVDLDTKYIAFMNTIPESAAKQKGIVVGHKGAEGIITLRQGDGRDANIGFVLPDIKAGKWELPSGVNPITPWLSQLRPFFMESPDQFRPAAPPALTSNEWARNYNEVKDWGGATSTLRTPEQTEIARFWSAHPPVQYNQAFRKVAQDYELNAVETARLLAMGNMVSADALIACFDAKYEYLFWRPLFAIPKGDIDGNPNTVGDSNWKPLLGTPAHPEYPSAHGCVTAAVAEVLTEVLGNPRIDFTVHSSVTNTDRLFTSANQLIDEVKYARIWAGIHYRVSTEVGADIGRQVARWSLKRYFLPEDSH